MPIDYSNPQPMGYPYQINIPTAIPGVFAYAIVQAQTVEFSEQDLDDTLESLVDHLQNWPGRHPDQNVTGTKFDLNYYQVFPINPIPDPSIPD